MVCCLLFVVFGSLCVVGCLLVVVLVEYRCSWFVVRGSLLVVCRSLCVVCCLLSVERYLCLLFVGCGLLCDVRC